eukprot:31278-Pelagococcus_subviridis.AAC.3
MIASAASAPSGRRRIPAVARSVSLVRDRIFAGTSSRATSMSASSESAATFAPFDARSRNPGDFAANVSETSVTPSTSDENLKTCTRLPVLPASKTTTREWFASELASTAAASANANATTSASATAIFNARGSDASDAHHCGWCFFRGDTARRAGGRDGEADDGRTDDDEKKRRRRATDEARGAIDRSIDSVSIDRSIDRRTHPRRCARTAASASRWTAAASSARTRSRRSRSCRSTRATLTPPARAPSDARRSQKKSSVSNRRRRSFRSI